MHGAKEARHVIPRVTRRRTGEAVICWTDRVMQHCHGNCV